MMPRYDLVIIGAGPAGMAAAIQASDLGLSVAVLDEQNRAGGQIYRDVDVVTGLKAEILGEDYAKGGQLTQAFSQSSINYINGAVVWAIEDAFCISYTRSGRAAQIMADRVILATGALERPMPIPGWTMPGVMTAGAGQILLKQSGVAARTAVLVGAGPLLYLIAAQMVRAGTPPVAMIETQSLRDAFLAMKHWRGAISGWRYIIKGLKMLAEIKLAKVPRYTGATEVSVEGRSSAEAVTFTHSGRQQRITCDTVFLHHGVVPNAQAARSLGVPFRWCETQAAFVPVVDDWGQTNLPGVFIVGDGVGIGGAKVAEHAGRIAALKVAADANRLSTQDRDHIAATQRRMLQKELAIRPFLDAAYPPYAAALQPADSTIICRCEEVTAGDIRGYAKVGCAGPNQTKAFGRAGMGPCQGRYCGLTVTALLARANEMTPDQTGYYRIRPPLKPVTLGELAAMDELAQDAAE